MGGFAEVEREARGDLVRAIGARGTWEGEPRWREAFAEVPRHLFVPYYYVGVMGGHERWWGEHPDPRHRERWLRGAYEDVPLATRLRDGELVSSSSQPSLMASMLLALGVRDGDDVLEIGAGTGYNAALLAELAGPHGQVTTIDIDPEVTAQARTRLDQAGYPHVRVATADGQLGDPDHAPYDRLIVTVGPWDIPQAWWQQVRVDGRMVLPLRWRGQARAVAFLRHPDRLESVAEELCGFVPMLGDGQDGEHSAALADGKLTLTFDQDQPINPAELTDVFDQPSAAAWSGQWVGPMETLDEIWLRLTATEPGTCRLVAEPDAITAGLQDAVMPPRYPALIESDSLAYLTLRRADDRSRRWELGARGHGPHGARLARRIVTQIQAWGPHRTVQPTITAYPAATPTVDIHAATIIDKPLTRLTITY